jgi:hypothetical protein
VTLPEIFGMTLAKTHWDSICKMVFNKAFEILLQTRSKLLLFPANQVPPKCNGRALQ